MTDDFSQLENQLRALSPAAPSMGLERRLAEALCDPLPRSRQWWEWLGFHHPMAAFGWGIVVPTAAAAMAVTLFHLAVVTPGPSDDNGPSGQHLSAATTAPAAVMNPGADEEGMNQVIQGGAASTVLYEKSDEGVVMTRGQQPAHQTRYLSEDTLRWRNPRTGATIEVSYPREEVVVTPIFTR